LDTNIDLILESQMKTHFNIIGLKKIDCSLQKLNFNPRSSPYFQRTKIRSAIDFSEFGHQTINHIKL